MTDGNGDNAKEKSLQKLPLGPSLKNGIQRLLQARCFAQDLQCDIWDFAVELPTLEEAGLSANELRWLVCKGFADHARETTAAGDSRRSFQSQNNLALRKRSCFVLTEKGWTQLGPLESHFDCADSNAGRPVQGSDANGNGRLKPTWDCHRQEFRLGSQVIKTFKLPSPNQQTILTVFEEEGWPVRIDDPLPPRPDIPAKRRLLDTIKSLNGNQKQRLVRFRGDGRGQGVRWELTGD